MTEGVSFNCEKAVKAPVPDTTVVLVNVIPEKANPVPETTTACPSIPNPEGVSLRPVKATAPSPAVSENCKVPPASETTRTCPGEPIKSGVSSKLANVVLAPAKSPV